MSCVRVREVEVVLRVMVGPELDTSRYERKYVHELKAVEPREERKDDREAYYDYANISMMYSGTPLRRHPSSLYNGHLLNPKYNPHNV